MLDSNIEEGTKQKICACCEKYIFPPEDSEDFCNICPICLWEEDIVQESYPNMRGGANKISLNEAKNIYNNSVANNLDPVREAHIANQYLFSHWEEENENWDDGIREDIDYYSLSEKIDSSKGM